MTNTACSQRTAASTQSPAATIGPGEFSRAFPFHFVVDEGMRILQYGESLARIATEIERGALLADSFSLIRPVRSLDAAVVLAAAEQLVVLEHRHSAILFRGQFMRTSDGRGWVFLGSPWFTSADELESAGLSLADFAPQDPIAELLLIAQTQQVALGNLWQLNEHISSQREQLRRTESLYRSAIAAGYAVPYQECFATDSFEYVGEGFEELTGRAPGSLRPSELRALEADTKEKTGTTKILQSGDAALRRASDYAVRRGDGSIRWVTDSSVLLADAQGKPVGAIGILYDITSRKAVEVKLQASKDEARRLAIVASRTSSGVLILDAKRRIQWANEASCRLLGLDRHGMAGRHLRDVLGAGTVDRSSRGAILAALDSGVHYRGEARLQLGDGRSVWVSVELLALREASDGRITGYIVVGADITDSKEYEQRLARFGRELDAILGVIPGGVVALDEKGKVAYFNAAFEVLIGVKRAQLQTMVAPELDRRLAACCDPERAPAPFLELDEGDVDLIHVAHPGPATIARTVRIVTDPNAATQWRAYYLRDITREAEIDRMKSDFLSLAAHELRTPMSSVHGFAELLVSRSFDTETSRTIARTIHRQSSLLVHMVNELLDLARIESGRGPDFVLEQQPLEPIVRDVVESILVPDDPRRAEFVTSESPAVRVNVDGAKLRHAVTNVLSNAYKYSRGQGVIRVWLPQRVHRGRREVGVRVADEGIGMTPEQLARVFERFYRADPSGDVPGTGLGMSLVKSLIEAMAGHCEIASEPGRGTTVTLWLPVAPD